MPERPYGLWDSPVTARQFAEQRRLETAAWDSDGHTLVWLEGRSDRGMLVAQGSAEAAPRDLTADHDVRAEVGYGGGDFTVHGGAVYFVERETGRIYRQPLDSGEARPITPPFGKAASPAVSPDGRWLVYVHHDGEGDDRLAVVDTEGRHWPQILAVGHDFFMQARWSPDARTLAWIAWDHPNMPWDGTWLYCARLREGSGPLPVLDEPQVIAGGTETAVFQPEFTPDGGSLLCISDETGWGRLVLHDLQSGERRFLSPDGVELGRPAWMQDLRTYAVLPDGRSVVAAFNERGVQQLQRIDLDSGETALLERLAGYTEIGRILSAPLGRRIALIGSSPRIPPRLVEYDLDTETIRIVARASGETVPADSLADCSPITWSTTGGEECHGLFYPPTNERFEGRGKPPLVVLIHGGPTSQVRAGWRPEAQFLATRGYAVLYVNYRGSTGYGREYMLKLRGNWGVCDVEDALSGAEHLAESGRVDPERRVIMGGSAGGFTVLQTMAEHPEAFTAGISLFGVADQFHLAAETHKFESRYLDSLLGPLPEAAEVYRRRSPVFHAERIRRPLALFQGEIDRIVPRAQSDRIAEALRRTGTPHEYHVYEGEGHGWRKRETVEHFYRTVEAFLRRYVIFAS